MKIRRYKRYRTGRKRGGQRYWIGRKNVRRKRSNIIPVKNEDEKKTFSEQPIFIKLGEAKLITDKKNLKKLDKILSQKKKKDFDRRINEVIEEVAIEDAARRGFKVLRA